MTAQGHEDAPEDAAPRPLRQALDAVAYAATAAGTATVVSLLAGFGVALGSGCAILSGLVFGKQILFLAGFAVLGYGALKIRPRRSDGRRTGAPEVADDAADAGDGAGGGSGTTPEGSRRSAGGEGTGRAARGTPNGGRRRSRGGRDDGPGRFAELVQAPLPSSLALDPDDRLSTGTKVVVAGFTVLLVSFALELAGLYPGNFPC